MLTLTRIVAIILTLMGATPVLAGDIDWTKVEAAFGRKAAVLPDDVHRFGMPRDDLHVTLAGVTIRAALALGAWAAFHPVGEYEAMVMGDLVLTEPEVGPVLEVLEKGGVEVTAVHNHLIGESPKIMYIHMGGRGDPVRMAQTIAAAIALTGTPPPAEGSTVEVSDIGFDVGAIEAILGRKGSVSGGVLHISVPRAETLTMGGVMVPPSMGTGTAINFQQTTSGRAVTYGDFALTGGEVETAIRTLRENGMETMALHNHMLREEPRFFYVHFWGINDAATLAKGLRAALDQVSISRK